jgi:hypothetical protein
MDEAVSGGSRGGVEGKGNRRWRWGSEKMGGLGVMARVMAMALGCEATCTELSAERSQFQVAVLRASMTLRRSLHQVRTVTTKFRICRRDCSIVCSASV